MDSRKRAEGLTGREEGKTLEGGEGEREGGERGRRGREGEKGKIGANSHSQHIPETLWLVCMQMWPHHTISTLQLPIHNHHTFTSHTHMYTYTHKCLIHTFESHT